MTIKLQVLVFYNDESSLKHYLEQFHSIVDDDSIITKCGSTHQIDTKHAFIQCLRGVCPLFKGHRAHIIAVQEDLTWGDRWPEIRDSILRPILISPIDVQIFDGGL